MPEKATRAHFNFKKCYIMLQSGCVRRFALSLKNVSGSRRICAKPPIFSLFLYAHKLGVAGVSFSRFAVHAGGKRKYDIVLSYADARIIH